MMVEADVLLMNAKLHYMLATLRGCCTFDMQGPPKLNQLSVLSVIDVDFPYKCFKNSICCEN